MSSASPAPVDAIETARPRHRDTLETVAGWSFVLFAAALPMAMAPMNVAGALCAALTLIVWIARPGARWVRSPIDLPALGWLLATVIATVFALEPGASAARLGKGLIPLVTGFVAWHALDRRRAGLAIAVLLGCGAVASVIGFGRFVAGGAHFPARAIGFGGTWMRFGLQMMMLASLAAGIAVTTRERAWRLGALAAGAAATIGLVASYTRSAWLGLIGALAVMLAVRRPRGLLVLAAIATVLWFALPGDFGDRLRSSFDARHPRNVERTLMWESGVRVFRDHPITGVGLQNLVTVLDRYRSPLATEHPGHVHNSYLQAAVATGIVGLVAFLGLCVALLRTVGAGLVNARRASGLAAGVRLGIASGVVGFLIAAQFDHAFGDEPLLFLLFTLAGISWAALAWDAPPASIAPAVTRARES